MDVAPQPGHRQRVRLQHHGAEQLRGQLDVPALAGRLDHFAAVLMEEGGGDLLQLPVILLVAGAAGEAGAEQHSLGVEAIAGHP
ncbi:hypothetical protein D3C75_1130430 [compost metagenome]